jgi:hypothetical protein
MATPDLDIHLRMRHIARTQAMRPRLRGNLKQLGAVGPVVRPLPAHSRQAFVKVQTTRATTTGRHLAYLQHQKGPEQQDASLFGPAAAARQRFTQEAQHDPHQFRLVLMVREHAHLDLTRYTELFMAQVERDLGRPLDWVAANHCDTEHPHTHIVLRGRDRAGKDLYMERDYFQYGLRARASQLLTWFFGPQRLAEQQLGQQQAAARLAFNGVPQGLDDPDARNRVAQTMAAVGPDDDRPPGSVVDQQMETQRRTMAQTTDAGRPPAEVLAQFRGMSSSSAPRTQASMTPVPIAEAPVVLGELAARLTAMQQALAVHALAMQRGQGMGF